MDIVTRQRPPSRLSRSTSPKLHVSDSPAVKSTARPEKLRQSGARTNRFWTQLLVRLYWQDEKGCVLDGPGVIRDISADGFGLEFNQSLAVDQFVTVRTAAATLECVVRHAKPASTAFLIDVQVLAASRFNLKAVEMLCFQ